MPFQRLPASEKPTYPYILVVVLCVLRYRAAVALAIAWSGVALPGRAGPVETKQIEL